MKKIVLLSIIICLATGCTFLKTQARENLSYLAPTEVTEAGSLVMLTDQEPKADCQFKGIISGDMNPDVENRFLNLVDLTPDMQADLRNNAATLGGNTVWVRGVDWHDTEISVKYPTPFVVNNVQYGALVYWCPKANS